MILRIRSKQSGLRSRLGCSVGSVTRLRAEYRRARRTLRTIQETYDETIEELGDALSDLDGTEAIGLLAGLDRLEGEQRKVAGYVSALGIQLDDAREERKQSRREAWSSVRAALDRFGRPLLEVVGDVLEIAADRPDERISVAVGGILRHSGIPLGEEQIEIVTDLGRQIVEALSDA